MGVPPEQPSRPDEAEIRRALAECMTAGDIDDAMGWAPGTARRRRWRAPERGGLPNADAELGGMALWFRTTIEAWRATPAAHRSRRLDATTESATTTATTTAGDTVAVPVADPVDAAPVPPQPGPAGAPLEDAGADPHDPPAGRPDDDPAPAAPAVEEPEDEDVETSSVGDVEPAEEEPAPAGGDAPDVDDPEGAAAPSSPMPAGVAVVGSGFDLAVGQHVVAEVRGGWRAAVVAQRDRRTVVVEYQLDDSPLGARRQRVGTDRVRIPAADA